MTFPTEGDISFRYHTVIGGEIIGGTATFEGARAIVNHYLRKMEYNGVSMLIYDRGRGTEEVKVVLETVGGSFPSAEVIPLFPK